MCPYLLFLAGIFLHSTTFTRPSKQSSRAGFDPAAVCRFAAHDRGVRAFLFLVYRTCNAKWRYVAWPWMICMVAVVVPLYMYLGVLIFGEAQYVFLSFIFPWGLLVLSWLTLRLSLYLLRTPKRSDTSTN